MIGDGESVIVVNGPPDNRKTLILSRPGEFEKPRVGIDATEGHGAGRMIGMSVRHQDIAQSSAMLFEREAKLLEVTRLADTSINQDSRRRLNQQIGVVAGACHGTRIVRVERDCFEQGVYFGPAKAGHYD